MVTLFLLLGTLTACVHNPVANPVTLEATDSNNSKPVPPNQFIVKPVIHEAKLTAIGDVLIHDSLYVDAKQNSTEYNFKPMFKQVKKYIEESDISIANQETIIGGTELGLSGYPAFNSPIEVGYALKELGVDIVTTANNHSLDRGEKGIIASIQNWKKIGIPYTGSFQSVEDQKRIRTLTKNDITFSFLSYTYGTNGIPIPKGKDYLVNLINKNQIQLDMNRASKISDVQVVSMHWGEEYQDLPNEQQKEWAQFLADLGVDIVIGHHPHVLQPPNWIKGKQGNDTYVFYSLGNFISGQMGTKKLIGGIMDIKVTKTVTPKQTKISIHSPGFVPIYTHYQHFRDYNVYPMNELNNHLLPNFQSHLNNTITHIKRDIPTIEIH